MPHISQPGKVTHLDHPSGGKVKVGGYRPDPPDPRDRKYSASRMQPENLPAKVDLRPYLTEVENQGHASSCTANALAGAYEYLEKRVAGAEGRVSRLFIYYNERDKCHSVDKDDGGYLRDGILSLKEHGACCEDTWPYDLDAIYDQPHEQAYEEAREHTIDEAMRVEVNLHDMRHCLAEGYPFVFGLELFEAFQEGGKHGHIPMPDESRDKHAGGHAMLCVGYSDQDRVFLVRNSWGTDWGDGGYCYIPYDYLANPRYTDDCWTVRQAHNVDFTQGILTGENGANDSFFEDDGQDSEEQEEDEDTQDDTDMNEQDEENGEEDEDEESEDVEDNSDDSEESDEEESDEEGSEAEDDGDEDEEEDEEEDEDEEDEDEDQPRRRR